MAVPKKKPSRSRRGNRRSHDALRLKSLALCPQCATPKLPHRICPNCGMYRGKVFSQQSK